MDKKGVAGMEKVTNEAIYELLIGMTSRLDRIESRLDRIENRLDKIEETVGITKEHVAKIDERLHEVEKVKKLFDPAVLEKIG